MSDGVQILRTLRALVNKKDCAEIASEIIDLIEGNWRTSRGRVERTLNDNQMKAWKKAFSSQAKVKGK